MINKIRKALLSRELSVAELISDCMEKAKAAEECNAFTALYFQEVLEKAEQSQRLINSGNAPALCGIPIAVKDNIAYGNRTLSCGSEMLKGYISPYSATAVENLQKAGALIIGKTNMDEFGMGSHTRYSCYGGVKNPINHDFSPGGSSGGSAVAVKSGAAVAALGSDTGGSVRLPSAYCGACGLRPTYGAVSRYGLVSFASSMDTIGVLGNTPSDCYELFKSISSRDPLDSTSKVGEQQSVEMNNLKICSFIEAFSGEADGEVYAVLKDFLNSGKNVCKELEEVKLETAQYIVSVYYLLSSSEAAGNLARFDGIKYGRSTDESHNFADSLSANRTSFLGDEVKKRILLGNYALSKGCYDKYYRKALSCREVLRGEIRGLLRQYDAIVLPTALTTVPKIVDTKSISQNYDNDKCNAVASLCGLPALSFPVGRDKNGMPVSLSIIGREFGERYITELAEKMLGGGGDSCMKPW